MLIIFEIFQIDDGVFTKVVIIIFLAEAIFIPNPNATSEDDGLILASVTDTRPDVKDYLLFIDARNMTEVARASFDEEIPFHSHVCAIHA